MALCDDIIDYNKKMESYIEKYGNENHVEVKITSYGSGSQLLLNYQKRKFDVIFLDVSMPEMDGFETAEEIRKSDTDVSIVFCTSYYTITNAGKGFEVAAEDFLSKPLLYILLVEDDKEICFILTELLKRNHYNVSAYHNGIEAIEALSSKKYDLMLLDLMLPDLPGEKILFHLKKHNNSIPVIVISAKNQPEIRINLLRSGADDYITKPFYHEEVLARIESVLRRCSESPQTEYSFKDIRINVDDHKVLVNNTELTLTTTEYNLLQWLNFHAVYIKSTNYKCKDTTSNHYIFLSKVTVIVVYENHLYFS